VSGSCLFSKPINCKGCAAEDSVLAFLALIAEGRAAFPAFFLLLFAFTPFAVLVFLFTELFSLTFKFFAETVAPIF
jgi:hypothetical protein